ncbi:MAG: LysR family transcriptional regulator [Vibrio toranzoniae]|jgi:DNA-binding transcriptional LysR family regulator|uniref:Transcriptional regulator n=1 Tax=Vibrio toranzoniae TaxID=1194427 RepID=A0A109DA57_9VIBR|nr:LysR family transcriptional regulator [Vibrio toranzoniae]KWU01612.1 transcriptional regulator [Vibrio toranzoniae]NAZ47381.1 LysR family transcriptional regulator [Vibrio toranzoniae]NAZ69972.1 LysR family transcriptional regulator [Vibrio toranzoniae]NAZ98003.1 LysR family transcriptional regulator [Vibrio toranzoniae]SBS24663.1 HTH-type transcriptional regulator DmlR [Vibrio toranzoniae]
MKIEDLKLFTTVVELGSFTAAANALDLPRANVSRRINDLEKTLNIQLFFRTTRSLSVTKSGELYYNELLKALSALEKANHVASNLLEVPHGRVKIGLLPETGDIVQSTLFKFQDLYPEVELDIRSISNGFLDMYRQGLDLAMHGGRLSDSNVVARKVMDLRRIFVASPEYIKKYGKPSTVEELSRFPCVCFRWPSGDIDKEWQVSDHIIKVEPSIVSDSIGFVKGASTRHRGIALLPELMVRQELKDGSLINLFPIDVIQKEEAWLLYPQRKALSHASQLLIDFLLQELPNI